MNHDFQIVNHIVRVDGGILPELLAGFECDPESISALDPLDQEPICRIASAAPTQVHGVERQTPDFSVSHVLTLTRDPSAVLLADDRFEHTLVRSCCPAGYSDLLLLAVYSRLAYFRTVFTHGALIRVPHYGGILFTGRSGVGKTTQATLWAQCANAEIINGDKVFLAPSEEDPHTVYAYGSPWKGSSPYCVNCRVPLRAVIDLNRETEHYIRPLNELEALSAWMPAVFLPNWDVRLTEMVLETLDTLLPQLSVYRMSCTKDANAVEMAARALGL